MPTALRLLIAAIQGLGAVLLMYLLAGQLELAGSVFEGIVLLLFLGVTIAALAGAALLAMDQRSGWQLSLIVQTLQVPQWSSSLLGYQLQLGATVVAGVEAGNDRFALILAFDLPVATCRLLLAGEVPTVTAAVNLLALGCVWLLYRGFRRRFATDPRYPSP